jgi:hypothetical protein
VTPSVVGASNIYSVPSLSGGAVLVGYYFNSFFACPNIVPALSAANVGGQMKKSTVNACVFIAYVTLHILINP